MASNTIQNDAVIPANELNEETAPIEKLPDECLLSILDHLTDVDLIAVSLVSNRFNVLADRMFRVEFANQIIAITKLPSKKLQKFGSSIRGLRFEFDVNEEIVEEVCELCPNLKRVYFQGVVAETFTKSFVREMFPQLDVLQIERLIDIPDTSNFRRDIEATLQCCTHLYDLSLVSTTTPGQTSNIAPFLQVVFPKLHRFKITLNNDLSTVFLLNFLRSNKTIEILSIKTNQPDIDLSGIWELKQLDGLSLMFGEDATIPSINPNAFQLHELSSLKICSAYSRDNFKAFFESLKYFQNLSKLRLKLHNNLDSSIDIRNQDLMQLKYLPNLTSFDMSTGLSYGNVTLLGILEFLKCCPKLTEFQICGFQRTFSADGSMFVDDNAYGKFCEGYFNKVGRIRTRTCNCKWYTYCSAFNLIHILKRCLE